METNLKHYLIATLLTAAIIFLFVFPMFEDTLLRSIFVIMAFLIGFPAGLSIGRGMFPAPIKERKQRERKPPMPQQERVEEKFDHQKHDQEQYEKKVQNFTKFVNIFADNHPVAKLDQWKNHDDLDYEGGFSPDLDSDRDIFFETFKYNEKWDHVSWLSEDGYSEIYAKDYLGARIELRSESDDPYYFIIKISDPKIYTDFRQEFTELGRYRNFKLTAEAKYDVNNKIIFDIIETDVKK